MLELKFKYYKNDGVVEKGTNIYIIFEIIMFTTDKIANEIFQSFVVR